MIPIYHRLDSTTLSSYPETLARMLASKCQNALKHQSLGEENLFAAEVAKELDSAQSTAKSIMDAVKNSVLMGDAGLNTFSGNTLRNLKEIEEDLNSIQKFSQLWSVLGASRYPIILLIDDISYLNPTEASLVFFICIYSPERESRVELFGVIHCLPALCSEWLRPFPVEWFFTGGCQVVLKAIFVYLLQGFVRTTGRYSCFVGAG